MLKVPISPTGHIDNLDFGRKDICVEVVVDSDHRILHRSHHWEDIVLGVEGTSPHRLVDNVHLAVEETVHLPHSVGNGLVAFLVETVLRLVCNHPVLVVDVRCRHHPLKQNLNTICFWHKQK